jgi:hypothetical protein
VYSIAVFPVTMLSYLVSCSVWQAVDRHGRFGQLISDAGWIKKSLAAFLYQYPISIVDFGLVDFGLVDFGR